MTQTDSKAAMNFLQPGIHESKLIDHFGAANCVFEGQPLRNRACIMVFTNRSGSNYLSELLSATGQLPQFGEAYNHDMVINMSSKQGLRRFPHYVRRKLQQKKNGLYTTKLSVDQVMMMHRFGIIPNMFKSIDWLFIRRRNVLDQAISYSIALQTLAWTSLQKGNTIEPEYDFDRIAGILKNFSEQVANALQMFAILGYDYKEIIYEDLVADPQGTVEAVGEYMGIKGVTFDPSKTKLTKQSSQINEQFKQRFLEEVRAEHIGFIEGAKARRSKQTDE